MTEPPERGPKPVHRFHRGTPDLAATQASMSRVFNLLAACIASPLDEDHVLEEFERLINEDPQALYGLAIFAAGLVREEALRNDEDPLDALRDYERALEEDD